MSEEPEKRKKMPIMLPVEIPRKFSAPVICHILFSLINRPNGAMDVVSDFVI